MRVFNPLRRQAHIYPSIPSHRQVRYFEGSKRPGRCRGFGLHGLRVCVLEESTRRKRVQDHHGIKVNAWTDTGTACRQVFGLDVIGYAVKGS